MAGDPVTVLSAVENDLAVLGDEVAGSGLAAAALELARQLDGENSATSKSMCARSLVELMREIRALAPDAEEVDRIDDLASRRAGRRAS